MSAFSDFLGSPDFIADLKVAAIVALLCGVIFLLGWLFQLRSFRSRQQKIIEDYPKFFLKDVGRIETILTLRLQYWVISALPFATAPLMIGLTLCLALIILDRPTQQFGLVPNHAEVLSGRVNTLANSVDALAIVIREAGAPNVTVVTPVADLSGMEDAVKQLAAAVLKIPAGGSSIQFDASGLTASVNGLSQEVKKLNVLRQVSPETPPQQRPGSLLSVENIVQSLLVVAMIFYFIYICFLIRKRHIK